MKVKYSVFPFVPAFIAMMFLKLMSLFGLDGNGLFLGMNVMNITYTVIGISIGLFIVSIILNIFDRKTAPVYPVKRNVAAGALSLLSGAAIIAASAARFSAALSNSIDSEYYMMIIICAIFSLPAGIALMLISKVHFQGKSIVSNISMLFVFPALWGCAELVSEFLMATKASIYSRDLTSMFCYIFMTLYLFSNSMIVSRIKGRNPVKSCFIYGLPAVAVNITFGVYEILRLTREGYEYSALLAAVQFIILGLYAASFIAEMFMNSYTKDEFEVVDGLPADDKTVKQIKEKKKPTKEEKAVVEQAETEKEYINTEEYEDLVFSERPAGNDPHVKYDDDYYTNAKGLDDFIIGYSIDEEDDEPIPYFTKHEQKNTEAPLTVPYQDDIEMNSKKAKKEKKKFEKKSVSDAQRMLEEAKKAEIKSRSKNDDDNKKAAEVKMEEQAKKLVEAKKAEEAEKAAKANQAEEEKSNADFVNAQLKKSQVPETKDDDYYERRLNEINNLLKDFEK